MVSALCSDTALSMLGRNSGFGALMKVAAPHIILTHCVLHRREFLTKALPPKLVEVLKIGEECVNYVWSSALKHNIFKRLWNEMGSEFKVFLYSSNIWWLSLGKALNRVLAMHVELALFWERSNIVMQVASKILSLVSFWRTWTISSMLSIISINECGGMKSILSK